MGKKGFFKNKPKADDQGSTSTIETDVFLTHDWAKDVLGRDNHTRVSVVNDELKSRGYVTWFDTDRMTGNIIDQMCSGIDDTKVILVFITARYCQKVGGKNQEDNCKREFSYAVRRTGTAMMIPVVMEPGMKNTAEWSGALGMAMGGILYVDFSGDQDQILASFGNLTAEIDKRNVERLLPSVEQNEIPNHYVAIFDCEDAVYSLPFSKGDEFQVLGFTNDDWWLVKKLKDNSEGFVPATFMVKYGSLLTFPWYFGGLNRKDAEVILSTSIDGAYLVRPSESNPDCFTLSVKVPDTGVDGNPNKNNAYTIHHFRIGHSKEDGKYFLEDSSNNRNRYKSIDEIIQYYTTSPIYKGCHLTEPAVR